MVQEGMEKVKNRLQKHSRVAELGVRPPLSPQLLQLLPPFCCLSRPLDMVYDIDCVCALSASPSRFIHEEDRRVAVA